MAKVSWEELGLEEECYSCHGRGHECSDWPRRCQGGHWKQKTCKECHGSRVRLTYPAGQEFLEFLARNWDALQEAIKEERENREKKKKEIEAEEE